MLWHALFSVSFRGCFDDHGTNPGEIAKVAAAPAVEAP
jgi:hypothetical protein